MALGALRLIVNTQSIYKHKKGEYAASLQELVQMGLDTLIADHYYAGSVFYLHRPDPKSFNVVVTLLPPGKNPIYIANQSGNVWYTEGDARLEPDIYPSSNRSIDSDGRWEKIR
jgi:hypothetical protein